MDRRNALHVLAGFAASTSLMGGSISAQDTSDVAKTEWVGRILLEMSRIQPGMTRAELLTVVKTEGGISTALERTYVSQHCAYFKVDVTFQPVGRPDKDEQSRVTSFEDGRDQIKTISRPYLALGVMD